MFLLCNIYDRDYKAIYLDVPGVRFDISDAQLRNVKNAAWAAIEPGAIVCVVRGSHKISTFCRVVRKQSTRVSDGAGGFQHIIVGPVVAKLDPDQDMTLWLKKYNVTHSYLPNNKFSTGFNVADLGNALDIAEVRAGKQLLTIGQLKSNVVV